MPHEKVNLNRSTFKGGPTSTDNTNFLIVGWNPMGWVQISVAPAGWTNTGDWMIADVTPEDIDHMIRVLKKAKRKAYGKGKRHFGFEDRTD